MTNRPIGACRLHVDGAARGNPGPAAAAAVLYDAAGNEIWADAKELGPTTNNVAEYEALIFGLTAALDRCTSLTIAADSELVVRQLTGHYKVRQQHLVPLYEKAMGLLARFGSVEVTHVPRSKNARADSLANEALDRALGSAEAGSAPARQRKAQPKPAAGLASSADGGVYQLTVKGHFDAAHSLRGYPGKCKELHGHTWDIEVTIEGSELDEIGILYDFGDLKEVLAGALEPLDHAHLNDVPPFDVLSPTGENLARYLYDVITAKLPARVRLLEVVVWESPIARLSYRRA